MRVTFPLVALDKILSLVQKNLDKEYETQIAQVDFSAAFDLVNYNSPIFKLRQTDIGDCFLDVLTDFLGNKEFWLMVLLVTWSLLSLDSLKVVSLVHCSF